MATMTLAVPDDLKSSMDSFREINWSEVARQAITKKIAQLQFMREFTKNSTMTEEDAIRMGRELKKRHLAKGHFFPRQK